MTENKRFTMEESEGQDTIYDNEGIDDYYHLGNDTRDVKALCDLLNEQDTKIKKLEKSRDKWMALAENFSAFCDCYEKAINEVCDEETIEKIESKYAEYEEKVELK